MIRKSSACATVEASAGVSRDASRNSKLALQGFEFPVAVVFRDALAVWASGAAPLTSSVDGWLPRLRAALPQETWWAFQANLARL